MQSLDRVEPTSKTKSAKAKTKSAATKPSNGVHLSVASAEKIRRAAADVLGRARTSEILDAEQREAQVLLGG